MAKESRLIDFSHDKKDTIINLESIQLTLSECINEDMMDEQDELYNELIELLNEARLVKTYPELAEVITKAKTIEADIDGWLSMKHRETLSISWARIPKY
jgi:hypothetical protein